MLLHEEQQTFVMPAPDRPRKRWWRATLMVTVALLISAGCGVGGYFIGQDTRMSDREVAAVTERAVRAETGRQEELRRKALTERKARDKAVLRRVVTKMKRSAARKAEQSYASGQNVGFSSGKAQGENEGYAAGSADGYVDGSVDGYDAGLTTGSDELSCSDDPDIYWLPSC